MGSQRDLKEILSENPESNLQIAQRSSKIKNYGSLSCDRSLEGRWIK